ncbi:MAG: flagellar hook-associated protein FlgK, partial [Acidobacteria bacterium]|nr:flagellar hook-associated protein FlgK [Acidobacteriota bacterium]
MGNLLVSLKNTAEAMRVFQRGMSVVQSNVTNASTPGYAKQTQLLEAMRLDLDWGLPGGVQSGGTSDGRSDFAEAAVRQRAEAFGYSDTMSEQMKRVEAIYDIGSESGLGGALNKFFASFSALTVAPNDVSARQVALNRADELARSFRSMDTSLTDGVAATEKALQNQMDAINRTVSSIAALNKEFRSDFRVKEDAGIQARMNNLLEGLSEMGNFSVLREEDGSATVYLGGQTLMAVGERVYPLSVETGTGENARLLDSAGNDVTTQAAGGRLKALLETRNDILPEKQLQLNRLAQAVADEVNTTLSAGVDLNGVAAQKDLFSYDANLGPARTLAVTDLTPSELALASSESPGGNAVAVKVAELGQAKEVDGYTFMQFYATQAADIGRRVTEAVEDQSSSNSLVVQARQFREELQGVNLDEEAIVLMQ